MENNCVHFLVTRFNLRNAWTMDKNKVPTQTEEWLEKRFEMFEKYCLPSVAAQTNRNFTWLCLFDDQTPPRFRERIERYRKVSPEFRPVFFSAEQAAATGDNVRDTIKEILGQKNIKPAYLATTNLDNDDALSVYAVGELQKSMTGTEGMHIYSLLYGYQYLCDARFAVKMRYYNNHFLTLYEPFDQAKTIFTYRHGNAAKHVPTIYIRTDMGMWIEFVHDNNVSNGYRVNSRAQYIPMFCGRDFSKDFAIDIKVAGAGQVVKSLTTLPFNYVKTALKQLATKYKRKRGWK